jgi:D-alanyl-lipoteichoic acid acyltransferase DltB (MBOAT superfamily)
MPREMGLVAAGVYVVLGRWLARLQMRGRDPAFALLNIAAMYFFFFWGEQQQHRYQLLFSLLFAAYLALGFAQYLALRYWSERSGLLSWCLAVLMPVGVLVAIRYAPLREIARLFHPSIRLLLQRHPEFSLDSVFIGSSYLAFRTSHLALEVRNGAVPQPGCWEYLSFAFFAPTLAVGPINPYSQYRLGFVETGHPEIPLGRALLRVLVGAVKYAFLGPLLNQLTYSGLLLDGHPHVWVDLPIAAVAYYLYLYCNFSGFCDIAIGGAGLMGIPVAENFANPFSARNVKDFWNRWHITLSQYMRDVVFTPLSKALVRAFGPAQANHGIALTILVVFLVIGMWHGVGWNFLAFGALHGLGVAINHYYTIALKKWLTKEQFGAYNRNRLIHVAAVTLTFLFVAASLFLFANDWDAMKSIFSMLRMH